MRKAKIFKAPRWNNCGSQTETQIRLREWYRQLPGRLLLEKENELIRDALPTLFGYHLLKIGITDDNNSLRASRISHRMVMDRDNTVEYSNPEGDESDASIKRGLQGSADNLPFSADTLDVVVLNHTLEFSKNPHQVLREVDRALIPEGHVLVLGFNPNGLWLIWRLLLGWKSKPPWCGRFIRPARLRDWLQLLGYDIIESHYYFYRPPLNSQKMLKRLRFLERLGRFAWTPLSGAYIMVARKRVATITPLKPRWHLRRRAIASPELARNSPLTQTVLTPQEDSDIT
ncbi:MAG: class I SAM-dependent methyltransferase [Thiohalomonadales bacterium]